MGHSEFLFSMPVLCNDGWVSLLVYGEKKQIAFTVALSYPAGRHEYFLEEANGCNKQGSIDKANYDSFHQICQSCSYYLIYQNSMDVSISQGIWSAK